MNYQRMLVDFRDWMIRRGYLIDDFTSEFTIQHRLALFLDAYLSKKYDCELEVSAEKFGWKNLTKKEIDIVVSSTEERHAIELKFIHDQGSFNIGIYGVCEDVRFLEELKDRGFNSVCSYAFTTLSDVFTPTKGTPNPKNPQNMSLYVQFRNAKNLQGKIAIKTGTLNNVEKIGDVAIFFIFLPAAWPEIRVRALLWQQSYVRPHHLTKAHERRYLFSSLFVIFGDVFAIAGSSAHQTSPCWITIRCVPTPVVLPQVTQVPVLCPLQHRLRPSRR